MRDPPERVLERIGGENAGGGIDEGVQRSAALLRRHVRGNHNLCIGAGTRQLDRLSTPGVPFVACGTGTARRWRSCASGGCPHRSVTRHAPERRVEAEFRRERESEWTPERRAAALEAERRRHGYLG